MHGPLDPIIPAQPCAYAYLSQVEFNQTHPFPFVKHPYKMASQAVLVE